MPKAKLNPASNGFADISFLLIPLALVATLFIFLNNSKPDFQDKKVEKEIIETQLASDLSQVPSTDTPTPSSLPSPSIAQTPTKIPTPTPTKIVATPTPKPTVIINNNPPSSGYSRQTVQTEIGSFTVSIVSADLNNTRVIVDTAPEGDCANDCPVLPLADYVTRNGAFAGINGSFFCPATYPQCAGKTNSFDTLLMNKNKRYFNSDNNVYSTVPAVIFSGNSARFINQTLEWGRDTGVDAVLANYPLLVFNSQVNFTGSGDGKLTGKGPRCFISARGSTVYIGIVHNASSADAAVVLKTLGMENALGLDQGGSTALWYGGGYKAGPGRNIPNALLFVRK